MPIRIQLSSFCDAEHIHARVVKALTSCAFAVQCLEEDQLPEGALSVLHLLHVQKSDRCGLSLQPTRARCAHGAGAADGYWRIRTAWHAFPDLQIQLITTISCKLDSLAIHQ